MSSGDLNSRITCTACYHQIILQKPHSAHSHPILNVLLCKVCMSWSAILSYCCTFVDSPQYLSGILLKHIRLLLYPPFVSALSAARLVGHVHCHLSTVITRMSYWVTQFYLPPDRGNVPAVTPSRGWYSIYRSQRDENLSSHEQVYANVLLKDVPWWSVRHGRTRT